MKVANRTDILVYDRGQFVFLDELPINMPLEIHRNIGGELQYVPTTVRAMMAHGKDTDSIRIAY